MTSEGPTAARQAAAPPEGQCRGVPEHGTRPWRSMSFPLQPSWLGSIPRRSDLRTEGPSRPRSYPGGKQALQRQGHRTVASYQDLTSGGLNLEGVKRVIELEAEVARLRQEVAQARAEARAAVDQVHRHYRRDLVPLDMSPVPVAARRLRARVVKRRRVHWLLMRTVGHKRPRKPSALRQPTPAGATTPR